MKKIILFLLFPTLIINALFFVPGIVFNSFAQETVSNVEQAFLIIKHEISTDALSGKSLVVHPVPIKGGTSIPTWGKTIRVPTSYDKAWFFFVDDQPQANWGHKCRYFFVGTRSGRYSIIHAKTPPDDWSQMVPFRLEKSLMDE
ncbi:MAG: hypothetical protein MI892_08915 [Desulfobacterales bacterium]|nr:hypothetical protein [Desulfobacterales bacterium]